MRKPIEVNWSIRRTRGTGDTVLLCFSHCRHKVLRTYLNLSPMLSMKLNILINMKSNKNKGTAMTFMLLELQNSECHYLLVSFQR